MATKAAVGAALGSCSSRPCSRATGSRSSRSSSRSSAAARSSTAGVATLLTNALPIAAGTVLFHEGFPAGALGALRLLAFALVVAGAALLGAGAPTEDRRPQLGLTALFPRSDVTGE